MLQQIAQIQLRFVTVFPLLLPFQESSAIAAGIGAL
jgi:hypothetical protein